jgi:hypothetical protein
MLYIYYRHPHYEDVNNIFGVLGWLSAKKGIILQTKVMIIFILYIYYYISAYILSEKSPFFRSKIFYDSKHWPVIFFKHHIFKPTASDTSRPFQDAALFEGLPLQNSKVWTAIDEVPAWWILPLQDLNPILFSPTDFHSMSRYDSVGNPVTSETSNWNHPNAQTIRNPLNFFNLLCWMLNKWSQECKKSRLLPFKSYIVDPRARINCLASSHFLHPFYFPSSVVPPSSSFVISWKTDVGAQCGQE